MNTNMAPNVSIQRNQSLPGPMSPRFQQGVQGQAAPPGSPLPTQQNPSPMLRAGAAQQRMAQQLGGTTTQPQWRPRTNPAMMNGGTMAQVRIGLFRSNVDPLFVCVPKWFSSENIRFTSEDNVAFILIKLSRSKQFLHQEYTVNSFLMSEIFYSYCYV